MHARLQLFQESLYDDLSCQNDIEIWCAQQLKVENEYLSTHSFNGLSNGGCLMYDIVQTWLYPLRPVLYGNHSRARARSLGFNLFPLEGNTTKLFGPLMKMTNVPAFVNCHKICHQHKWIGHRTNNDLVKINILNTSKQCKYRYHAHKKQHDQQ